MKSLCFATNNAHKIEEVAHALGGAFQILTLAEIGCTDELPETTGTIPGNSRQKARYVADHFQIDCFADDSGLEVDALNGEPGVDTAYYSGTRDHAKNNAFLLQKMEGIANRRARFRAVITLIKGDKEHQFEGIVEGQIATEPRGTGGFGYDPIFIPEGHEQTFGELGLDVKNTLSHRAKAVQQLVQFLGNQG
ncbi:RdgB/HAM1 family non-canonical purine NTP pyrophosphatase [Rudanella paleaurantiibacter]|uniref:dITP/XTP pyrophosphatase n=1 Tax=Rudanella paleaurantiibacter TaxID=2614655 RepID=A0A7J5U366_9BACT|nr:RdgB/HAM1 family non-canonical purine NTP pyrophosphatase [Rudanella paleaurantiibacter]KAB7731932.1 RdgB/HAM1 family non-canonical purine NTP pyrophosphatase [Rudanella paleaurantiibacter]